MDVEQQGLHDRRGRHLKRHGHNHPAGHAPLHRPLRDDALHGRRHARLLAIRPAPALPGRLLRRRPSEQQRVGRRAQHPRRALRHRKVDVLLQPQPAAPHRTDRACDDGRHADRPERAGDALPERPRVGGEGRPSLRLLPRRPPRLLVERDARRRRGHPERDGRALRPRRRRTDRRLGPPRQRFQDAQHACPVGRHARGPRQHLRGRNGRHIRRLADVRRRGDVQR